MTFTGAVRVFCGSALSTDVSQPLGRPGNDLLSRVLRRSTIGAGAFHGRVRNGIGCSHPGIITRSAKAHVDENWSLFFGARREAHRDALVAHRNDLSGRRLPHHEMSIAK